MTVVEVTRSVDARISPRQRWSHYFVLIFGIIGVFMGMNLRDSTLNAVSIYVNTEAGIRAAYPRDWLRDSSENYVFRVRNTAEIGFKTTIQIAINPVGSDTTAWNVLTAQTLNRAQTLAAYNVTTIEPYTLPDETQATIMNYSYVAADPNPFLESVPTAVRGSDILVIKRGQAIIITFLSDAQSYEQNVAILNQFLRNLEF
ncbi:MAG: hypothetical protein H6672_10330 [Anaerolineaceae bacterium]|nr:hypothetical protein [Anaerolineaceae bacterium]